MYLVYFLFLPSALLSVELLRFAADAHVPVSQGTGLVDLRAWLNTWMVVGCFALAARWLEKAQRLCFDNVMDCTPQRQTAQHAVWIFHHRESLLLWLWCVLQPICLVSSGWAQWTHRMTLDGGLMNPRCQSLNIILSLIPSVVLLLLVDLIRVSRIARSRSTAKPAGFFLGRVLSESIPRIANTWLIPMLLPVAMAFVFDLVSRFGIIEPNHGLLGTIACTVATSACVTLLLPHLFVRLIGAEPMDGTLHALVESAWRLRSRQVPRILLWPTGCRMPNAAVVGLFAFGRKLLLTDALLQRLNGGPS
jgi:hypothetical protein